MKYIIITIFALAILGGGYYFYQSNDKSILITNDTQQNMNNNFANSNNNQEMVDFVKQVYQAFVNKDVDMLRTLSKIRNQNNAITYKQPFDSFEEQVIKDFMSTMNDPKAKLLPLDYSTLQFVPEGDSTVFHVVAERITKPFAYKEPITYYEEGTDFAQVYEIHIQKINGAWQWVK